jgi:hypothetical protein
MQANGEWCRWSIEGDHIILTIPDSVYDGKYPIEISPVGDTFGYTSKGITSVVLENYQRGASAVMPENGVITSISAILRRQGNNIVGKLLLIRW